MCPVLFDRPVGEQAWPEDGSIGPALMAEMDLLQKVQEIIKANPEKAESLLEKFHEILKEENKADLICNNCPPVLIHQNENQLRDSGSIKILQKRGVPLRRKVAKKKQASKGKKVAKKKKDGENLKSRKAKKKKSGVERPNKTRKLNKIEKQKEKKKKKTNKKTKKILKMKKTKQQRKVKEKTRQRTKYLEKMEELNNCTSLWAKLTNVGLGVASIIQKQVTDIHFNIKVISFAGKFHKKQ